MEWGLVNFGDQSGDVEFGWEGQMGAEGVYIVLWPEMEIGRMGKHRRTGLPALGIHLIKEIRISQPHSSLNEITGACRQIFFP